MSRPPARSPVPSSLRAALLERTGLDCGTVRWESGPLARTATRLARAEAMVLGRRILLSTSAVQTLDSGGEEAVRLLAHELAHVEQYRRVGFTEFLLRYAGDYFLNRLRGASHTAAYRSIAFEREAQRLAQIAGAELR